MDNVYLDKAKAEFAKLQANWQQMSANVQSSVADAKIEADRKQKKMQLEAKMNELKAEIDKGQDAAEDTISNLTTQVRAWMDELSANMK